MKPRVYLVDGSALAYRSYFAFVGRPLVNSKGENTSAVYGVANTLLKLLREEKPDYISVVFDSRVPTFRHTRFPEYKANREKMPEEMQTQFPRILELVSAMGLKIIEARGFEADDVMGTLAKRLTGEGVEVVLVSGDKDFCQLVGENVRILSPRKAGEDPVSGSWFAGVKLCSRACDGDCSYETFCLERRQKDGQLEKDGRIFNFCKTAFRPYDIAVTACLLIAKHVLQDEIIVRTDGDDSGWFDAKMLCQSLFGYGLEYEVVEGEIRRHA